MDITESPKFAKMCRDYLTYLKEELDTLRQDIEQMNFEQIHNVGHKTKGTSGAYKLGNICSGARALQEAADIKDAQLVSSTFDALYNLVMVELQNLQE